jgi:hypothetical protein
VSLELHDLELLVGVGSIVKPLPGRGHHQHNYIFNRQGNLQSVNSLLAARYSEPLPS